VWLDPPRRTAPDGSAFQLQHWTHDFAYALVSSTGDWRAAHLPAEGQDFNTPLLGRTITGGPGRHPTVHSLLAVEPERSVLLSTLKPAGNPIAGGRRPASISEVTLRLAESTGVGAMARITGPLAPDQWRRADLLERPDDRPAPAVALGGLEIATLVGTLTVPEDEAAPLLGPAGEVAQPVYSRYWLHNRGPAPMGFLPVTIAASPGLVPVDGGSVTVDVVVASNLTEEKFEGVVTLHAPDGWSVEPAEQVFRVAPSGSLAFAVTVRPPASVPEGLAFLAARIVHDGQTIEDVVTLVTGEPADLLPVPGPAPDQKDQFRGTQSTAARATGLDVEPTTTELTLRPGQRQTLGLRLTNRTNDTIRGEIQLVAPWGTWDWLPDVVRGFAVAAGATSTVDFDVVVPQAAETGHAWALARVAWFGRCQYAQAVRLEVVA
jgi:hypothetical protein